MSKKKKKNSSWKKWLSLPMDIMKKRFKPLMPIQDEKRYN